MIVFRCWIKAVFWRGLSRLPHTPTTREASATWQTGPLYAGAILMAVCALLVVAPPISRGIVRPRRSISAAFFTISSSEGVISPLKPMRSAWFSAAVCRMVSQGTMTPRSITR